tara:strand:+ start:65898 stop:67157 length:1260 start_codon:yes stop_codon:yes gene_type:complete
MIEQKRASIQESKISLSPKGFPKTEMISKLEDFLGEIPCIRSDTFSNFPVKINANYLENAERLGKLLNDIIVKIVYNYTRDERVQDIIRLDKELLEILLMAESTPYEIGMYRPDFVYDVNGQAKICEIGCRYPINGWMLSYFFNLTTKEFVSSVDKNWEAIPNQENFISEFSSRYDKEEPIFFIHNKEKGTEIHYLKKELAKNGIQFIDVNPKEFKLVDGQLMVKDQIARQFYLEMDREELKAFDKDVLKSIIASGRCINDVRTILLIHDKRILTILFNEEIMPSYTDEYDYAFLKNFLIPSFTIYDQKDRDYLIKSSGSWVLKNNSGGRGIDIYLKNECGLEVWKEIITKNWQNYMVQEYVAQKEFVLGKEKINIVGMNLYFNGQSFGPGVFRGSSKRIINLHDGNGVAFPCVLDKTE